RAHKSLTLIVAQYIIGRSRAQSLLRTRLCHCSLEGREYRKCFLPAAAMLFDQAIPKGLAIFISGGTCEQIERVCAGRRRLALRVFSLGFLPSQRDGAWPVNEAPGPLVFQSPLDRLPFRREFSKRHE